MKSFKKFTVESRTDPAIQSMLLAGAKGLFDAWWDKIKQIDAKATPLKSSGSARGFSWMKDWQCACTTINGKNSDGDQFFMELMLQPQYSDDGDFVGTRILIHDAELPDSWQKTGVYSAGLKWLVDHKSELKLTMEMVVHVSTNDDAWRQLARKFKLNWLN